MAVVTTHHRHPIATRRQPRSRCRVSTNWAATLLTLAGTCLRRRSTAHHLSEDASLRPPAATMHGLNSHGRSNPTRRRRRSLLRHRRHGPPHHLRRTTGAPRTTAARSLCLAGTRLPRGRQNRSSNLHKGIIDTRRRQDRREIRGNHREAIPRATMSKDRRRLRGIRTPGIPETREIQETQGTQGACGHTNTTDNRIGMDDRGMYVCTSNGFLTYEFIFFSTCKQRCYSYKTYRNSSFCKSVRSSSME